jgi:hypothetical protein
MIRCSPDAEDGNGNYRLAVPHLPELHDRSSRETLIPLMKG